MSPDLLEHSSRRYRRASHDPAANKTVNHFFEGPSLAVHKTGSGWVPPKVKTTAWSSTSMTWARRRSPPGGGGTRAGYPGRDDGIATIGQLEPLLTPRDASTNLGKNHYAPRAGGAGEAHPRRRWHRGPSGSRDEESYRSAQPLQPPATRCQACITRPLAATTNSSRRPSWLRATVGRSDT